ncbi:MAG TPA: sialidase family protein [Frankiaceae bacterium]|nr:sialidase family protein [Frankiaceae bacterium]
MHRVRASALSLAVLVAALPVAAQGAARKAAPKAFCETTVGGRIVSAPCALAGAKRATNVKTFEPTLGSDPEGRLFYAKASADDGIAIGFAAGVTRSDNGGRTWREVTPKTGGVAMPPETNDPYVYVDPATGRVFNFHMAPFLSCSILSYSDDAGATWTTNPVGCGPTGVWDHQTMVAAKPRGVSTSGYPNVLLQCVNAVYAVSCSRSLDGGDVWGPSMIVSENQHLVARGGEQTGHLRAAPDGTIYLPSPEAGDKPVVFVSEDSGGTWRRQVISTVSIPFTDPAVAVDRNGTVYATFVDRTGRLLYAVSRNKARTWTKPVPVTSPRVTATKPVLVVGDPGKIAIAFPGTDDLPKRFATPGYPAEKAQFADTVRWGGYIAVSTNALAKTPRFQTLDATGPKGLEAGAACVNGGRCTAQVDFIDMVTRPDGTVWAAFVDACPDECPEGSVGAPLGVVVTLTKGGDLCSSRCSHFGRAGGAAAAAPAMPRLIERPLPSAPRAPLSLDPETLAELRRMYDVSGRKGYRTR